MKTQNTPIIDWTQAQPAEPYGGKQLRRWKTFLGVLLVSIALGLAFVYGRAPLYQATASVLTVQPKAVDLPSASADQEHVAIQRRLLLGEELLGRVAAAFATEGRSELADINNLRGMLTAEPVPETNLLELRAEGEDPALLQRLVNLWAQTYEAHRAGAVEQVSDRTSTRLEEEQTSLQARIDAARAQLQAFRVTHGIVSQERPENLTLARLNGLNDSLNRARARLADANARLATVEQAKARGEAVVPPEQKADLARQELEVERLRERLGALNERYTDKYLERDPVLKTLPGQLRELERGLERAKGLATRTALAGAQQDADAAQRAVAALEADLAAHQREVQEFTERFNEFKALEAGLARLEARYADNAQRLTQIDLEQRTKYPPVEVVDWASIPRHPLYPDYDRDLLIALAAALGLALFLTWLIEYLSERTGRQPAPYTGMRIFTLDAAALRAAGATPGVLPTGPQAWLPDPPRELTPEDLHRLLRAADPVTAACATLLLHGVAAQEFVLLHERCLDREARVLTVPGAYPRDIDLGATACDQIGALLGVKGAIMGVSADQLDGCLAGAAAKAGLPDPDGVTAQTLRYSYALFLVRQGARVAELPQRLGQLANETLALVAAQAPAGADRPLSELELTHPAVAG